MVELEQREINILDEIKNIIMAEINPFKLYRQKEIIDMLDISFSTFKKYFGNDEAFQKKAVLEFKRQKYYKGHYLRVKALKLNLEASQIELKIAFKRAEEILAKFRNRVKLEISDEANPNEVELNFELDDYNSKFVFDQTKEEEYWKNELIKITS